jgi:hypothetical protein
MRYALVDETNRVVNVIKWDGGTHWSPPMGLRPIKSLTAQINDTYDPTQNEFISQNNYNISR